MARPEPAALPCRTTAASLVPQREDPAASGVVAARRGPAATSAIEVTDGLGFHVDWQHQFEAGLPVFAQVSLDGRALFLTEHEGDCRSAAPHTSWWTTSTREQSGLVMSTLMTLLRTRPGASAKSASPTRTATDCDLRTLNIRDRETGSTRRFVSADLRNRDGGGRRADRDTAYRRRRAPHAHVRPGSLVPRRHRTGRAPRHQNVACPRSAPRSGDRRDTGTRNEEAWAIDLAYFTAVPKVVYLREMAVAADWQRQAIGRALVHEAIAVARAWPSQAIQLDAYDAAAGAEVYARCGFGEVGR